jgi:hypothetical protein
MGKPRIYYACPISGSRGHNVLKGGKKTGMDHMIQNCLDAKKNIEFLQAVEPQVDWICVAPHNALTMLLYEKGYLTVDQILEVDLEVVNRCHGLLAHFWEPSNGAELELSSKRDGLNGVSVGPVAVIKDSHYISECDWSIVSNLVDSVLIGYDKGDLVVDDLSVCELLKS